MTLLPFVSNFTFYSLYSRAGLSCSRAGITIISQGWKSKRSFGRRDHVLRQITEHCIPSVHNWNPAVIHSFGNTVFLSNFSEGIRMLDIRSSEWNNYDDDNCSCSCRYSGFPFELRETLTSAQKANTLVRCHTSHHFHLEGLLPFHLPRLISVSDRLLISQGVHGIGMCSP
jgi:hypothetical protein